ncbi:Transmembrane and coiled-coil domain-containing protein 4 [Phytophthora citrophthora]|uniref:Transmembrane and coiled-coil domain-containing protein 4 n=1 Tax=Phytophthora citrophthora TaxID=4793 RepID=A0AAD9GWQ2_9STRA|nr:Transmembrane and coiled-coil domain-containing protein 4 [Phytophthora citrophthora]
MKKFLARHSPASRGASRPSEDLATSPSASSPPIALEYAMDFLSESQKRGVAGLCACLLPAVTDGSIDLIWSKEFLKLLVEHFVGLTSAQTEAYLPILTSRKLELAQKAHEPSSATVAELDPAPFLALVVPENGSSGGFKRWTRKIKHRARKEDALVSSELVTIETFRLEIVKRLLWFTVKSVGYDARARTLLRRLVLAMELDWIDVTREEIDIGQTLYAEATAMPLDKVAAKPKIWDWKRNAAIGAAAVTGGALLAVTGGLAAPAIAASLTALGGAGVTIGAAVGSAAGVTATTVLFGTAGAGVMGMKADTRTRGVHDFSFDLVSAGDGMNVYICVSGWLDDDDPPARGFRRAWGDSREYLRAFYRQKNPEKVDQVDQVMDRYKGREDEFFAILRRTYSIEAGNSENDPLGIADLSKMAVADQDTRYSDFTSLNSDSNAISSTTERTSATTSSVWELGTKHEPLRAWRWKDRFPQGDQYCLMWEEAGLRRFGKSMRTFAAEQVSTYATTEIVKYTALAALFAAVAIPRVILRLADIIDNAWTVTMNAADTSGKLLAEALRKREQGLRPVTLIGYGMGARLIFSCLKELAKGDTLDESCGIVENAVLLGSPVPMARDDWANARRVVSGRLINGYSDKDWMLGVMYRYQGWALNSAGIAPIDIAGVENVDLSDIIGGHLEYKSKIGAIMDLLQLEG